MTRRLSLSFTSSTGSKFTRSFAYVTDSVTQNQVNNIVTVYIANGDIFNEVPVACTAAKIVTVTETPFTV